MRRSLANSNRCLPNPPPPLVATTRTRGVRVVSTGATGLASKRTPVSVSNHRVAPPFPQGAGRCSASAPLGIGSRRAAAIPGGECTHPHFVHGRGHAPAFGRFAHVSPSPLVARQSEFCGSRPSSLSWPVCDVRCARLYFSAVLGSIAFYPGACLPLFTKRAVLACFDCQADSGDAHHLSRSVISLLSSQPEQGVDIIRSIFAEPEFCLRLLAADAEPMARAAASPAAYLAAARLGGPLLQLHRDEFPTSPAVELIVTACDRAPACLH